MLAPVLQGVSNAVLCVDPAKVGAQVAVFDPSNRPIPPLGAPPAVETYAHSLPDTGRSVSASSAASVQLSGQTPCGVAERCTIV